MTPWTWQQLTDATAGTLVAAGTRAFSGHVCTDSRKAAAGDLFWAIRGKNHDAHAFVPQVIAAGVAGVVVDRDLPGEVLEAAKAKGVAILKTDDSVLALNCLAAAYRKELKATVIAVGGSNGKTTTKRILHTVLLEAAKGHASPKSFNNNIGMPLTMLEVEAEHAFVVLEIGTNAPGEIAALGEVCRPDVALITSIGLEHLELLGDLDGVAREEAAIAHYLRPGGLLVVPYEAPELLRALEGVKVDRLTVGRGIGSDMLVTDVTETMLGCTFRLDGRAFTLPLLGEHNALNALMAIAVARRLGLSDEQIQAGLAMVTPAAMRLEQMSVGEHFVINDAYNANPSSMAAALKTFAGLTLEPGIRRVAILGDMLELGHASEAMHRDIGAKIAASGVNLLVAIGPAMQHAAAVAHKAGVTVESFASTADAKDHILALLQKNDAILFKGSRGMALEKVLEVIQAAEAIRSAA